MVGHSIFPFAAAILLCTSAILLPVALPIAVSVRLRARWKIALPLGLAYSAGFEALCAAWLHQVLPFGWAKWLAVVALSSLFTAALLHVSTREVSLGRLARPAFRRAAIGVLILGSLFCAENFLILGKQGWDTGPGATPYFRPPFQNDGQRHVIVVNAILRGTDAPFLPGERLTYQTYWYHWTALTAGLFDLKTLYPIVQGAIGATSLLFVFLFLWSLARLFPLFFARAGVPLVLAWIALAHVDFFNVLLSLTTAGSAGLEADWSSPPTFFRYFSLKLVSLTAPQHAFFFAFLSALIGVRHVRRSGREGDTAFSGTEWVLTFFCVMSSPVMSFFFFPPYVLAESWRLRRRRGELLRTGIGFSSAAVATYFLFPSLFGFPLEDLFLRPGNPPLEWGAEARNLALLPVVWINVTGVLGLLVLLLFVRKGRWRRELFTWESSVFLGGTLFFYFAATGIEIRRHYSMVAAFAGSYLLLRLLPTARAWRASREWRFFAAGGGGLALALHAFFLYCYLGKPGHVDTKVAWGDYFGMNRIVREQFPGLPILSAVEKEQLGLDYPIVMEATTTFSATYHTAVHVKLSPEKTAILSAMEVSKEIVPFGARLGYRAILWGPVEDLVWGPRVRDRFVSFRDKLATVGSVSLYRLADSWRDFFAHETAKGGNFNFRIGKKLLAEGWRAEAVEQFQAALHVDPRLAAAHYSIAQALQQIGRHEWALNSLNSALKIDPSMGEAAFEAGLLLRGLGRMREAEQAFRWAITATPSFTPAYRELAALLFWHHNFAEAERVVRKAMTATAGREEMASLLTQIKQAQGAGKNP